MQVIETINFTKDQVVGILVINQNLEGYLNYIHAFNSTPIDMDDMNDEGEVVGILEDVRGYCKVNNVNLMMY